MRTIGLLLGWLLVSACFGGESANNAPAGLPFRVHGRLSVYCGNPACRIWVVGTRRILGVAESDGPGVVLMPSGLRALLTGETMIFGDFTVLPLTRDQDGVMRMVRVITGENLVVTDLKRQILRRVPQNIAAGYDDHSRRRSAGGEDLPPRR